MHLLTNIEIEKKSNSKSNFINTNFILREVSVKCLLMLTVNWIGEIGSSNDPVIDETLPCPTLLIFFEYERSKHESITCFRIVDAFYEKIHSYKCINRFCSVQVY